jgi:predicted SpoU family rRNA methylase
MKNSSVHDQRILSATDSAKDSKADETLFYSSTYNVIVPKQPFSTVAAMVCRGISTIVRRLVIKNTN